jgi:hypothetical protein
MTSRTFPLSRQRRRRIANKPPLVPTEDGQVHATTPDEHDLGHELEREPAPMRTDSGEPADVATHRAGARPPGAPRLPHEHDEYADPPSEPRPVITQAQKDVEAGLEDTDCRNNAAAQVFKDRKPGSGHCP